jgi:hypothetical protein
VARFRLEGDVQDRPKRSVVLRLPWEVRRLNTPDDPALLLSEIDR